AGEHPTVRGVRRLSLQGPLGEGQHTQPQLSQASASSRWSELNVSISTDVTRPAAAPSFSIQFESVTSAQRSMSPSMPEVLRSFHRAYDSMRPMSMSPYSISRRTDPCAAFV